ncbi:glucagon receptor [Scleropages formosus]|uniref:glucagon receptor n=1 Tax=Scleropages formosus TaxID=113540 RepID=UPI0010FAA22E|nr:gastric inhibitory polypeptide receptor [Scleropages formosus]
MGRTMKHMLEEWNRYREECLLNMSTDPSPSGLFCGRMFDQYACWADGMPNTTVKVPCPWYLPWYDQVKNGFVLRECGADGQWATSKTSLTWRDHSQCDTSISQQTAQENQMMILAYFQVVYTVGYSLSLTSLSLALVILLTFRKLRCTRNFIHANLFTSFILRAVSILARDRMLQRKTPEFHSSRDVLEALNDQALAGCRVAQILMQYCVGANYCWLLVEGVYLHNLLVLMVFSERSHFHGYIIIGWGTPVLFVVPWTVARYLYENIRCWEINENMVHWWIIRSPIVLAIFINFFIFTRIIQILISKLKAHQMRYTDYKFRLAKSTLTLIPLLGIHEVLFAIMAVEQTGGMLRNINLFFHLFFNSFQGFLVAVLYCFINKEVQAEIKKKWERWKLGVSGLDEQRTCSNTPHEGTGAVNCNHNPLCRLDSQQAEDKVDQQSGLEHLHIQPPASPPCD